MEDLFDFTNRLKLSLGADYDEVLTPEFVERLYEEVGKICTEAEETAYENGYEAGWGEGHTEGYEERNEEVDMEVEQAREQGYDDGYDDGIKHGYEKGWDECEGHLESAAERE